MVKEGDDGEELLMEEEERLERRLNLDVAKFKAKASAC